MDVLMVETLLNPPYDGTVANLLHRPVEEHPERVALEHLGEEVTYGELGERVERLAGGLHQLGLEPGDRLGVYLPNSIAFCETIWGAIHAGVIPTPLNPEYRRRELTYQLDHSDADAVVTSGAGEEHVVPVAEGLGIEVVSADPESEHETLESLRGGSERTRVERADEDVLMQPYTSGTTGKPKGVLLTHRNFRVQIARRVVTYTNGPVKGDSLVVLPMYHITGISGMLGSLCCGRTIHLLQPSEWDPDLVLRKLDEHDVPAFIGVATMFVDLLEAYDPDEHDLSSLFRAGQGGAKLPEPVKEEWEERVGTPLGEGYGLTETTAATHGMSSLGSKPGSIGQPTPHTAAKVVDDEGNELPPGEEGELLVRGPQVMKGYYKNPEANEEAFTEDGYFRTGDIASRDEENYFSIRGREKDMILAGGYNVYPSEVEDALYDHPEIHEAAVFGIPDERKGETVAAAVTLKQDGALTEAEIQDYVLEELAPYKHPRVVEIREELPKTGSGKIRKVELREELAADAG